MENPPSTPIIPVVDVLHGRPVQDDYRWLENGTDSKVQEWVEQQNHYADSILNNNANPRFFQDELVKHFDTSMFSPPVPLQGKYFWSERKPGEDQLSVYMKKGLDGEARKIIDANRLADTNTVSIDYWFPSPNGNYLAYGLSHGGDEMATLYVLNVVTGKNEGDVIPYARHARVAWLRDETGFFYTTHPDPATVAPGDGQYYQKIKLHILGEDSGSDELIFGKDRPKEDMLSVQLTLDGKYLFIRAYQEWNSSQIYLYDCTEKKLRPLIEGIDSIFNISLSGDTVFIDTNYKANNKRILSAPLRDIPNDINAWTEIVPEANEMLDFIRVTATNIIAVYMKDVCSLVKVFDHEGNEKGTLPLPVYSTMIGIGSRKEESEFFFGVGSFLSPKTLYYSRDGGLDCTVYRTSEGALSEVDYNVSQEWVTSKDGTRVPTFIICRADIVKNGQNPTVLYGYGGHGSSQTPHFLRSWVAWLENGGIYAAANIRGGGEYGKAWQRAGSAMNKQNTFDDFIAASEYLINQGYTSPGHLGILGGSNGGLMVGAVMVQRPDLYKAVVSRVPILDISRFHKFLIAGRWVAEFGNPDRAEEFEYLMRWSPYHNVKDGVTYPNVLFTTADKDTRVDPLHARKMTALLQRVNKNNVTLLRTQMDAGHGSGKPIKKQVASSADVLSFFAWQLGLKTPVF